MKALSTWLAAGLVCVAAPLQAQSEDDDIEALLDEPIVQTASRDNESANTAPATSTVITAEQLRRYGIRTLDEALNFLSLGMTTSYTMHAPEVGARGVMLTVDYGNHVLLLIDGHRMNEPWNGTAYFGRAAGVPIELIDRIEVVLGPGSVLYGSQAMLGVVHIVTKRAKDYAGIHVIGEIGLLPPLNQDGEVRRLSSSGWWSDAGSDYRVGAGFGREFQLLGEQAEVVIQAEYFRQSGPVFQFSEQEYGEDGVTELPKNFGPRSRPGFWGGRAKNSFYSEMPVAYGRLYWGDWILSARGAWFRRAAPYLDGVVSDTGDFDEPYNREIDRWVNLELSRRFALSVAASLNARLYADFYDYRWFNRSSAPEDCDTGQSQGCDQLLEGRTRVLGAELQGSYDWDSARTHSSLLGVDARLRHVVSETILEDRATGDESEFGEFGEDNGTLAFYAQHTARLLSPLTLNAGARLDVDPRFGTAVSPRGALVVVPWREATLKGIYSQAFRAPSAYERGYADPNSDVANRDLEAETVRSLEISFEQRFGLHRLFFGAFRSWWNDVVSLVELEGEDLDEFINNGQLLPGTEYGYQYQNLARIDNWGVNAAYDGAFLDGKIGYGVTFTGAFTRQELPDEESRVPVVGPQVFGNGRLRYSPAEKIPTFAVALQYQGRRLVDQYYEGSFANLPTVAPSWQLKATVSGDVPGVETLEYRVGANYSFAKRGPYTIGANIYESDERADLAPVPQLSLFAGLHYRFEP